MTTKRIVVLLGHPDRETLCGEIADTYERAAREAGHEVLRINVSDLSFDPGPQSGPISFLAYPILETGGRSDRVNAEFSFRR